MSDETANNPQVKVEGRDLKFRSVVGTALAFLTILVIIHFALAGLWSLFAAEEPPSDTILSARSQQVPPLPRLQAAPAEDEATLKNAQLHQLNSYGWVNHKSGAVRVPIERAMQLELNAQGAKRRRQSGN